MARKKTTLVSDAVAYIEQKILSYELAPGARISDNKIVAEMSKALDMEISRSPVREALLILQTEGLVTVNDNKTCVACITDRDVFEICEVRDAIELQSVSIVIDNGGYSQEQRAQLQAIHEQLIAAKDSESEIYSLDDSFHLGLVRCTGNNRLIEIAQRMKKQMQRVRWLNMIFHNRRKESNSEHEEILKALMENDKERAQKAIHNHNQNNQKAFQEIFETEQLRNAIKNIQIYN